MILIEIVFFFIKMKLFTLNHQCFLFVLSYLCMLEYAISLFLLLFQLLRKYKFE